MRDSTAVVIALIGVIVPATGLYLTTREKQQQVVPAAAPASTPSTDRDATPSEQAAHDQAAQDAAPAATESTQPRTIAGLWNASDDYRFTFSQTGTRFSYRARQGAADQGSGDGTIDGDRLTYRFDSPGGTGTCSAVLSTDGNKIEGSCRASDGSGAPWPVLLTRFILNSDVAMLHRLPRTSGEAVSNRRSPVAPIVPKD